ncbi:hypothetical protein I2I11_04015 [Pontibacter sp. 172403-2]|uniref:hypothetical protein n=1 Tax=Pontibacter rufus TaxID=2791028 RepID=UPI0018AF649D|nr:hypothetical protein [Pontibacter sp. 172403-2]MBF9252450.1 hypothetical protein [Pontibacter sp. 172403-2]
MPVTEIITNTEKLELLKKGCRFKIEGNTGSFCSSYIPEDEFGPAFTVIYHDFTMGSAASGTLSTISNEKQLTVSQVVLHQVVQVSVPLAQIEIIHE